MNGLGAPSGEGVGAAARAAKWSPIRDNSEDVKQAVVPPAPESDRLA